MLVDELRHVEHRHLLLSVEHGLEVVVSIDHATLLGVLQIVLLDIHPQLLGDLGTRHLLATDDCGEFGRRRHRLHECGIRLTSYGLLGWCLLWRRLLRWGLLLGRALLLRWHTISCECGNSGRGASYSVECGAQWGKCYFSHENASFPPGQRDFMLKPAVGSSRDRAFPRHACTASQLLPACRTYCYATANQHRIRSFPPLHSHRISPHRHHGISGGHGGLRNDHSLFKDVPHVRRKR